MHGLFVMLAALIASRMHPATAFAWASSVARQAALNNARPIH